MKSTMYVLGTAMVLALAADGVAGQSVPRSTPIIVSRGEFAVSPYVGYMVAQGFVDGPLNTSIGVQKAPMYGVQASFPLAPAASIVGTVGYSSGDLQFGVPILGGVDVGNTNTWVFDASVEMRAGSLGGTGRLVPVAQLGGGALRREVSVLGVSRSATDFMVSGGIGADVPLSGNIALRMMAKDYYGKADFGSIGPLTAKTKDLHTFGFTTGLRFSF